MGQRDMGQVKNWQPSQLTDPQRCDYCKDELTEAERAAGPYNPMHRVVGPGEKRFPVLCTRCIDRIERRAEDAGDEERNARPFKMQRGRRDARQDSPAPLPYRNPSNPARSRR